MHLPSAIDQSAGPATSRGRVVMNNARGVLPSGGIDARSDRWYISSSFARVLCADITKINTSTSGRFVDVL